MLKRPFNLSNFLQHKWKRTRKDPTQVGLSGLTIGQRTDIFQRFGDVQSAQPDKKGRNPRRRIPPAKAAELANRENRRPMNPNKAAAIIKAHSKVLTNSKLRGQIQRLAEAGHDVIGLTANEIIQRISVKDRPTYLKIKNQFSLSIGKTKFGKPNTITRLIHRIAQTEKTTSAMRRNAAQRMKSINPRKSFEEQKEHGALAGIANATNAQLENALRKLKIETVEISQPTRMALAPEVKTLLLQILRGIPIRTTQELKEHFRKTLANEQEILNHGKMNAEELTRVLVNHGVLPPERRR